MERPRSTTRTVTAAVLLVTILAGCSFAGAPDNTLPSTAPEPSLPDELVSTELENRALYGDEEEPLPVESELIFNKKDRETCGDAVLQSVRKKLMGKIPQERINGLTLSGKTLPIEGGVILRCAEMELNCSFELLFAQLQRDLEAEVNTALFEARGRNA